LPVPREELGDAPGRVVGNAAEGIGKVLLRVDAVELGAFYQRVIAAARRHLHRSRRTISFAADGDTAQGALGGFLSRASRPSPKQRVSAAQRAGI
jgi:Cft2 family RNA processing exonuclease